MFDILSGHTMVSTPTAPSNVGVLSAALQQRASFIGEHRTSIRGMYGVSFIGKNGATLSKAIRNVYKE
jgi:hypothetical protein